MKTIIVLTFDDALLNTYEVAFPIMQKHGIKGVAFIPTGVLTGVLKNFRPDKAEHMNIDQIRELHDNGWEIGSHSVTHPRFDQISRERIREELRLSRDHLSEFKPTSFAFPFGHGYYSTEAILEAIMHYEWVRTVLDDKENLINGIPIDSFPYDATKKVDGTVFVIHAVKDPEGFEAWIENLNNNDLRIITFKEVT